MNTEERRLLSLFRGLSETGRTSLLDYADFLASRDAAVAPVIPEQPLDIPRPARESVVKAIKRLSATYPMLKRDGLLHETSALMTQHLVHGRPAEAVIDELEALFRQRYEIHRQGTGA